MKFLNIFIIFCLAFSFNVFSQENSESQTRQQDQVTQKQITQSRQEAVRMHEQMAECIRSGKDISECRQTVWQDMDHMRGSGICPMTGEEMGQGMGRGHMKGMGPGKMGPRGGGGQKQQQQKPTE